MISGALLDSALSRVCGCFSRRTMKTVTYRGKPGVWCVEGSLGLAICLVRVEWLESQSWVLFSSFWEKIIFFVFCIIPFHSKDLAK